MSDDKPTDPTLATDGSVNVGDASRELQPKAVFDLGKLNSELGTNYASVDEAVKGLKNLKSFVGAKEEKVQEKVLDEGKFITREQYEKDLFYSQHEDLAPYKDIIDARAEVLKVSPKEVVEKDPILKGTLEKLRGYDDTEKARSVLMSSPRLGQVTDKLQVAQEQVAKGNYVAAEQNAVRAIMDAIGK